MTELPTGTVTFLFSDIVGSTRRWDQQPEAMSRDLAQHDSLLREAIGRHGGHIFKTVGDAFHAAFARASDAARAAVEGQRALAAAGWDGAVRMALHTGAADERDGDYFGPTLNRVARLRDALHGGQVALSAATAELVRDHLPDGVELRDLGEHRLKDLERPEHVYQLAVWGLPAEFPPLRTLDSRPNNLPAQRERLIGRDEELVAVAALLSRDEVGLVTFTGPGGSGKTRLAIATGWELLHGFADGVHFVDLAPLSDPALVEPAIAQTLGVREPQAGSLRAALHASLREKRPLLILDNFEQLLPAAPAVAGLLSAAPRLKLLVTSRVPLHLRGEHEYPVLPLATPRPAQTSSVEQVSQFAAVQLFIRRAVEARPDFAVTNETAPAVAEICYRLDGLPLAIELAAARTRLLSPPALLARLERRLPLLTGGARDLPARQQTLRNTIAWSHDLLTPQDQVLFRRLGVFVGGGTLEATEAICGSSDDSGIDILDGVASLLDKSLLQREESGDAPARLTMLETIREYANERLAESGEAEAFQRRHAAYYLNLAVRAKPELSGPHQVESLERFSQEHDNLRAAFRWSVERENAEQAVRLVEALWWFWVVRGHLAEGRDRLAGLLALSGVAGRTLLRARTLDIAGTLAFYHHDYVAARSFYEERLAIWRELGETDGLAHVLADLGSVASMQGDHTAARAYLEESLAIRRAEDDKLGISQSLTALASLLHEQGDLTAARALFEEGLAMVGQSANPFGVAFALNNVGIVAQDQGDYAAARSYLEQCLGIQIELGEKRGMALTLANLANLAALQGDYGRAHTRLTESLAIQRQLGDGSGIAFVLDRFAGLAAAQGQAERALRLAGAAAGLRVTVGASASPAAQAQLDQKLTSARAALGKEAAAACWAAGRAMTLEQAIGEATRYPS